LNYRDGFFFLYLYPNIYLIKLMAKLKHITVNQQVYQKLKDLGKAGDSFNVVLVKILQEKENKQFVTT